MPDWLGGEQGKALVASVALCHGIPHKGDKLLYRHYANRPWASLFESQNEYRQHLMPVFESVTDPTAEVDVFVTILKRVLACGGSAFDDTGTGADHTEMRLLIQHR